MKRLLFVIFFSAAAFAQAPAPAFESAYIRLSPPTTNPTLRGGVLRVGRYEVRTATMVDLISIAYNKESNTILGGPNWLDWDRFDVIAKVPLGASRENLSPMMQNLLADRFKLIVHNDSKPMPAFALTAGKGKPKLKEAVKNDDPKGCQGVPQNPPPGTVPYQVIACHSITMASFADVLRGFGAGTYVPDPVVDQTGITGEWDFELKFTPRNRLAQAGPDGLTLFDAVDKQLGLKLEAAKIPRPVLVVDSVNQTPTPNPPGTTIPPAPQDEFEVATIRPSRPDATGQNARLVGGRLDISNFSLKELIRLAWELSPNDEFLQGLPKFADTARFDIAAKVTTSDNVKPEELDVDTLIRLLRTLLIDRFEIKSRMEDRPVTAYTMTAKQPKLTKADPQNRTNCKAGAGTTAILNRLITCQNTNMVQLADVLANMANGYVRAPIKDSTGLTDYYDFSINFSGVALLPGARFDPSATAGTTDPNGSLTLPEAIEKQLGLKLELSKRPLPVLVIEHINETPTDN
jgi:uncharacterized protein (TIGR03435 family)